MAEDDIVDVPSSGRRPEAMRALLAEPKEQSVSPTAVRYDPDSRRRAQVFTSLLPPECLER